MLVTFIPAYFSRTCFCNIPAHWRAEADDGRYFDMLADEVIDRADFEMHARAALGE